MITRRRLLQAVTSLPLAGALESPAFASPKLAASPLAGHFTASGVRLWLQAEAPAEATLRYWPAAEPESAARTLIVPLAQKTACAAVVDVGGLKADTRYRYSVLLGQEVEAGRGVFRTAPLPDAMPRDFRVYMGSCAYTEALSPSGNPYGDEFHIFDSLAQAMAADRLPHFMLWLGDNLYFRPAGKFLAEADFDSVERMEARYREVRAHPMFQKLFTATHHYAIWDDHDYGPNDADRTFRFKSDALRLFRLYWPNPVMGASDLPGTWTRFTHQDAEFFLLDDRYYRDNEKDAPADSKTMFGTRQLAWLKRSLKESRATFKIVANGSQLLSEHDNGTLSGWHNYRAEREDFLSWLGREKIPGLLFVSGDRHNTQVFRVKPGAAPAVHEFSCSPFTSRLSKLSRRDRANPYLVAPLAVEKRNFGTLEFTGDGKSRRIVGRCFDAAGAQLWEHTLATAVPENDETA